ncbi:MAG: tRNA (guanine(46)-N(7))-methyltransferase TrmB [Dongiaceae bacterium]
MQPGGRPNFYGRRQGRRLRPGRRGLLAQRLPELTLTLPDGGAPLDPKACFAAAPAAVWLEIGFGGGEHLAAQAAAHPGIGLIGAEVFVNGIASLLDHLERGAIGNVRIFPDDARLLLPALPAASLDRVFLLFPDPWPKARHAARRFVGRPTLDELARTMRPGAELRIASDEPGYVAWTLQQVLPHPAFAWTARRPGDWRVRPAGWPPTRYEQKALAAGRRPAYLTFERRAGAGRPPGPAALEQP